MTMMMVDDDDDDEGWGCGCYPFTRSDLDMWCRVHAGLLHRRWPGRAPAGALANLLRRGSGKLRLNYEELSFPCMRVGCWLLLLRRKSRRLRRNMCTVPVFYADRTSKQKTSEGLSRLYVISRPVN